MALASVRFAGTHSLGCTHRVSHESFNPRKPKIVAAATDKGSNFMKALPVFGVASDVIVDADDSY